MIHTLTHTIRQLGTAALGSFLDPAAWPARVLIALPLCCPNVSNQEDNSEHVGLHQNCALYRFVFHLAGRGAFAAAAVHGEGFCAAVARAAPLMADNALRSAAASTSLVALLLLGRVAIAAVCAAAAWAAIRGSYGSGAADGSWTVTLVASGLGGWFGSAVAVAAVPLVVEALLFSLFEDAVTARALAGRRLTSGDDSSGDSEGSEGTSCDEIRSWTLSVAVVFANCFIPSLCNGNVVKDPINADMQLESAASAQDDFIVIEGLQENGDVKEADEATWYLSAAELVEVSFDVEEGKREELIPSSPEPKEEEVAAKTPVEEFLLVPADSDSDDQDQPISITLIGEAPAKGKSADSSIARKDVENDQEVFGTPYIGANFEGCAGWNGADKDWQSEIRGEVFSTTIRTEPAAECIQEAVLPTTHVDNESNIVAGDLEAAVASAADRITFVELEQPLPASENAAPGSYASVLRALMGSKLNTSTSQNAAASAFVSKQEVRSTVSTPRSDRDSEAAGESQTGSLSARRHVPPLTRWNNLNGLASARSGPVSARSGPASARSGPASARSGPASARNSGMTARSVAYDDLGTGDWLEPAQLSGFVQLNQPDSFGQTEEEMQQTGVLAFHGFQLCVYAYQLASADL